VESSEMEMEMEGGVWGGGGMKRRVNAW